FGLLRFLFYPLASHEPSVQAFLRRPFLGRTGRQSDPTRSGSSKHPRRAPPSSSYQANLPRGGRGCRPVCRQPVPLTTKVPHRNANRVASIELWIHIGWVSERRLVCSREAPLWSLGRGTSVRPTECGSAQSFALARFVGPRLIQSL